MRVYARSRVLDGCLALNGGLNGIRQDDSRAGNSVRARMIVGREIASSYAGLREPGGRQKRCSPVAECPN